MPLYFQSLCSSSSGNCLALWSETTRLLIDCGLSSMKRTRQALAALPGVPGRTDSVLLTHTHSDHISYYPLRVLEDCGFAVCLHDDCVDQLRAKHYNGYGFKRLTLRPYTSRTFSVGEFTIQPFKVAHHPHYPTYGFRISGCDKRLVIATDFLNWTDVFEYFVDADFIFVESNHDLALLRRYFNPNSRFHMPNPAAADLLVQARIQSRNAPQTIILGHLSSQRNEPALALRQTREAFRNAGAAMDFDLQAAPLREAGQVIRIG